MNDKYYICLNKNGELLCIYKDSDIDYFEEHYNTRNPYEIFDSDKEEEKTDAIYVCELTNQGLVYKKRLNRQLEEVDL